MKTYKVIIKQYLHIAKGEVRRRYGQIANSAPFPFIIVQTIQTNSLVERGP